MNFHKEWKLVFTLSVTERKKIVVKLKEIMAGFVVVVVVVCLFCFVTKMIEA